MGENTYSWMSHLASDSLPIRPLGFKHEAFPQSCYQSSHFPQDSPLNTIGGLRSYHISAMSFNVWTWEAKALYQLLSCLPHKYRRWEVAINHETWKPCAKHSLSDKDVPHSKRCWPANWPVLTHLGISRFKFAHYIMKWKFLDMPCDAESCDVCWRRLADILLKQDPWEDTWYLETV